MKRKLLIICASVLCAACTNEVEEAVLNVKDQQTNTFTITATTTQPASRTYVETDKDRMVNNTFAVYWSEGDEFAVLGEGASGHATLQSGEGTTKGLFKTTLTTGEYGNLQYAFYPRGMVGTSGTPEQVTFNLPTSYRYGDPSNAPMYAIFSDTEKDVLTFKHLCAMLRLRIKGIPTEEGELTLRVYTYSTRIAGRAVAKLDADGSGFTLAEPAYNGGSKEITFTISENQKTEADGTLIFDIPVPPTTYSTYYYIALAKGEDERVIENISTKLGVGEMLDKTIRTYITFVPVVTPPSTGGDETEPEEGITGEIEQFTWQQ